MTRKQASRLAKKYSERYCTLWYVREVQPGEFEPWAHSSDDARTVETWHCGQDWSEAMTPEESQELIREALRELAEYRGDI